MKLLWLCVFVVLLVFNLPHGNGSRILVLTPLGSKSHKIFYMAIVEALAKRGHQLTVVSGFEPSKKIDNVREVVEENFSVDPLLVNIFNDSDVVFPFFKETPHMCLDALEQPQIQALKNETFDLILTSMFFNYCFLSFVHHFQVPYIYSWTSYLFAHFHDMIGNIDFPAITGDTYSEMYFPFTFKERLETTIANAFFLKGVEYYLEPKMRSMCIERGLCPHDIPQFSEFHKNASMMIINSVRTLEYPPRPAMPNVIYAGGAHIKPSKKLPKDLEDWVQESGEEGFIVFSLGSALNADFLPEKYREILVKVFGSLKQRVLWKWNQETMPDLPKNVKLQKWIPQSDLLGHSKIKLFITHGGLLSTMETAYHGIPVIGMPIFADQISNMLEVEYEGWGKVMHWKELEENSFRKLLLEVLSSTKMAEIAKHKSVLMKDRLVPPDEEAAYWVEYVIRHNGAPHIRSPVFMMKWYEIYNIDVWAFIILVTGGGLFVFCIIIKFLLRKSFGIGKYKKDKKKQV